MRSSILVVVLLLPSMALSEPNSASRSSNPYQKFGVAYPPEAALACAEGRTVADVVIGADGIPTDVILVQSSGNADLDAATKEQWLKSKWKPATINGQPVPSRKRMGLNFTLNGAKCVPGQGPIRNEDQNSRSDAAAK
jgi:TonB family protein